LGRGRLLKAVAPGLLAGVSNVDACAVLCLLSVGATYGYSLLWALALGFLLYAFTLQLASEVALVTGRGLAENIRGRFGDAASSLVVLTAMAANLSLITAEIAGAAVAISAVIGLPLRASAIVASAALLAITCTKSLDVVDEALMALSGALLAYPVLASILGADGASLVEGLVRPLITNAPDYWLAMLAVVGMALGPNVLLYEASTLVERGAREGELPEAMASCVVGSLVSLAMCIAIVVCGVHVGEASETMIEAVEVFRRVFGGAAAPIFSSGLFAGSMLAAVITLHSTIALLSETYGWRGVEGGRAWALWSAILTAASLMPLLAVSKPVKVAIVSSILSSVATIPPLIMLAMLLCDGGLMRGFEAKGYMKAVTWVVVAFFTAVNVAGLMAASATRPLLGYVTVPLDLLVAGLIALASPYLAMGARLIRRGRR